MTDETHQVTARAYEDDPIFRAALSAYRSGLSADVPDPSTVARWTRRGIDLILLVAVLVVFLIGYGLIDNRWYRIVAVQGASMTPTLRTGDAIILTRPPSDLEVGMIVTLEVEGSAVTHRVVSVGADGTFATMGDANSVPDDWSSRDVEVIGVQRARIPFLGKILTALAGVRASNAWLLDRIAVSGSTSGAECFGSCITVSDESLSGEVPSTVPEPSELVPGETASDDTVVEDSPAPEETPPESDADLRDADPSTGDTIAPPSGGVSFDE